jgi:hypothetical protein
MMDPDMDDGAAAHFRALADRQLDLRDELQAATDEGTRRAVATKLRDVRQQMLQMLLHPHRPAQDEPRARRRWDAA